jgi:hypothetical protein
MPYNYIELMIEKEGANLLVKGESTKQTRMARI